MLGRIYLFISFSLSALNERESESVREDIKPWFWVRIWVCDCVSVCGCQPLSDDVFFICCFLLFHLFLPNKSFYFVVDEVFFCFNFILLRDFKFHSDDIRVALISPWERMERNSLFQKVNIKMGETTTTHNGDWRAVNCANSKQS